eukprot:gene3677-8341_t
MVSAISKLATKATTALFSRSTRTVMPLVSVFSDAVNKTTIHSLRCHRLFSSSTPSMLSKTRPNLSPEEIIVEENGHLRTIILNRPKAHNALTLNMVETLLELTEKWSNDPNVQVVSMRGAGEKAFCAGKNFNSDLFLQT